MRYIFDLAYLMVLLLAGSAVTFMIWVFWNLSREIRGEVRARVARPIALSGVESPADEETAQEEIVLKPGAELYPARESTTTQRRRTLTPKIVR
jgi:hypothetical protein